MLECQVWKGNSAVLCLNLRNLNLKSGLRGNMEVWRCITNAWSHFHQGQKSHTPEIWLRVFVCTTQSGAHAMNILLQLYTWKSKMLKYWVGRWLKSHLKTHQGFAFPRLPLSEEKSVISNGRFSQMNWKWKIYFLVEPIRNELNERKRKVKN